MSNILVSNELAKKAANTIRLLAVDGIEKSNSGHPGLPMGMADIAFVLWQKYLKFNPKNPNWAGRDRFILSPGHGSMLLYSLLFLYGYDITKDDLKEFRQFNSKTPGHPEHGHTPGVEVTTGPLGQGFANGIGMALAAKLSAKKYNRDNFELFGKENIFAFVSDGDLMEGLSSEAASLAGHLELGNLIYIYDCNNITIEGNTNLTFSEDIDKRFQSYGWQTISVNGHVHRSLEAAIEKGINETVKPTIIIAKTKIGFGSPKKQNTSSAHGSPLGTNEVKDTKINLNWGPAAFFYVPTEIKEICEARVQELEEEYDEWESKYNQWAEQYPLLAEERNKDLNNELPENLDDELIKAVKNQTVASRIMSGQAMQKIAEIVPTFIGGSADLSPSTKTHLDNWDSIQPGKFNGKNIHFGIRENAMGSILNGMALYGGFIPFGSTFLVFSDYMRPAIRMAAMMKLNVNFVFTHDSFHVGEDGPTHQPIEQIASLRLIPNLTVFRPADAMETALSWSMALRNTEGPNALLFSRQKIRKLDGINRRTIEDIKKGGYIISNSHKHPDIILIATGAEVDLAIDAKQILERQNYRVRVVSMPCLEIYKKQSLQYRNSIIPIQKCLVAVIEAGSPQGWQGITWNPLHVIGIDKYGISAPNNIVAEELGFVTEKIAHEVDRFVGWIEDYDALQENEE